MMGPSACPFLEYHFVFDKSRPFCCAVKSGKEVPESTVQFTCSTGRYRLCNYYNSEIVVLTEGASLGLVGRE
ncbi:hypothetical protein EXS73_02890 [Candidatus Pacearchaeota archaeon]|nr:hypothetical protein [Candidatus Pacearchaeota archaeon]